MLEAFILFFYQTLPFSFALSPTQNVDLPIARVFIVTIFCFWLYWSLKKKQWHISAPAVLGIFFFWLGWATLSSLWSLEGGWSLRKIIFLLNLAPLFVVLLACNKGLLNRALQALVVGVVGISLVGLMEAGLQLFLPLEQVLTLWLETVLPFFLGTNFAVAVRDYPSLLVNVLGTTYLRITAFFPDPHTLSLYLGLSLPLVFVRAQEQKSIRWWLALLCVSLCFLLTFSRGAYFALCIVAIVAIGIVLFEKGVLRRYYKYILLGVFVFGSITTLTPIGARFLSSWSGADGSRIERMRLLSEAVGHVSERPFLGVGLGNYPILVKPTALPREPIYVHNLYLDIAVEQGLIGLLLFSFFIGGVLWSGFCVWLKKKDLRTLACFLGVVYFLLHGLFEAPLFSYHVISVLFLLSAYQVNTKA